MHVNDAYNIPDEQGRVLINIGHAENEEGIYLAPQIARVIKPHQVFWFLLCNMFYGKSIETTFFPVCIISSISCSADLQLFLI